MSDGPTWPPLVLAGPVVRRSDETAIHIWLATSAVAGIRAIVHRADLLNRPGFRPKPLGRGETTTIKLGDRLHIGVVAITPSGSGAAPFPTGQPLAYDLAIYAAGSAGEAAPLAPRRLMDIAPEIAYPQYSLPTLVLPVRGAATNILHGSCRKLHGPPEDVLQVADGLILRSLAGKEPASRPTALFLTGDQIYADDVADELINHIITRAVDLLGFRETLPLAQGSSTRPVADIGAGERGQWVKFFFTPDQPDDPARSTARNHMLGFGEFCFLYLLSLHEAHWPSNLSRELGATWRALPAVRRVLANIPTYMICDDHEITDDWNFNGKWHDRAYNHRTGRRVIANGLAAYWAFQAWGDDPATFGKELPGQIASHVQLAKRQSTGSLASDVSDGAAFESALLNRHWEFDAPTVPPAIFIDSRTRRSVETRTDTSFPMLVNPAGIRALAARVDDLKTDGQPLLVIATTPVLGHPAVERDLASHMARIFASREKLDLESWRLNAKGYAWIVTLLASKAPQGCIILSGDVHYAFGVAAKVTARDSDVPFFQFTSSALKNAPLPDTTPYKDLEDNAPKAPELRIEKVSLPELKGQLKVTSRVMQIEPGLQLFYRNNLGQLLIDGSQLTMLFHTYDQQVLKTLAIKADAQTPQLR